MSIFSKVAGLKKVPSGNMGQVTVKALLAQLTKVQRSRPLAKSLTNASKM